MKSILISIQPQWVEKILNGEKTIEIRTTIPKCELPCKVYIYCTNGYVLYDLRNEDYLELKKNFTLDINHKSNKYLSSNPPMVNRKIIAEFTLNKVEKFDIPYPAYFNEVKDKLKHITDGSCLTLNDLHRYLKTKNGYAWFIDDLKIYDNPKELSGFTTGKVALPCGYGDYSIYNKILKRPPQSWCYVEGDN